MSVCLVWKYPYTCSQIKRRKPIDAISVFYIFAAFSFEPDWHGSYNRMDYNMGSPNLWPSQCLQGLKSIRGYGGERYVHDHEINVRHLAVFECQLCQIVFF